MTGWPRGFAGGFDPLAAAGSGGDGGGPSYDADTQAYFDAVEVAGGDPFDTLHKDTFNTLVLAIKAGGFWPKIGDNATASEGRLFWFANQHATATRVTIVNPAEYIDEHGTLVFTADRHYASNGSDGYLDLNYNPTDVEVDKTDFGFTVYDSVNRTVGASDCIFGAFNGGDAAIQCYPCFTGEVLYTRNTDVLSGVANATARGIYTCTRSGTNVRTYKNGAEVNNETGAAGTMLNLSLFACGFNNEGTPAGFSTDGVIMVAMHKHLSAGQVAAFHTAIEACADALGAGVL